MARKDTLDSSTMRLAARGDMLPLAYLWPCLTPRSRGYYPAVADVNVYK